MRLLAPESCILGAWGLSQEKGQRAAEDQAGWLWGKPGLSGRSLSFCLSEKCCCYYSPKTLHNPGPARSSLCHVLSGV